MKPDGIHIAPGTIPGINFPIYLDESLPEDKIYAVEVILPKPRGSPRVNYDKQNYCARCQIKYNDKKKLRCDKCGNRVRTKPWHGRSNFANGGRY